MFRISSPAPFLKPIYGVGFEKEAGLRNVLGHMHLLKGCRSLQPEKMCQSAPDSTPLFTLLLMRKSATALSEHRALYGGAFFSRHKENCFLLIFIVFGS